MPDTTKSYLTQAQEYAGGKEYAGITTGIAALNERRLQVQNEAAAASNHGFVVDAATALADTMSATPTVPAKLRHTVALAASVTADRFNELEVIKGAIQQLEQRRSALVQSHVEDALSFLRTELDAVLTEVREKAAILGGISTIEQALMAGEQQAAAWRGLGSLIVAYKGIRHAQVELTAMVRGRSPNPAEHHQVGVTRTLQDPDYLLRVGRAATTSHMSDRGSITGISPEPWPSARVELNTSNIIPSIDEPAYLLWLAERDDVWIPTMNELNEAIALRAKCVSVGMTPEDFAAVEQAAKENTRPGIKPEVAYRQALQRFKENRTNKQLTGAGRGVRDVW